MAPQSGDEAIFLPPAVLEEEEEGVIAPAIASPLLSATRSLQQRRCGSHPTRWLSSEELVESVLQHQVSDNPLWLI